MTALPIGKTLGDYEVQEELGVGGMGVAYRAFDRRLKRTVALKTVVDAVVGDSSVERRLLHEARAAARLAHPNICTIHAVAELSGLPVIVMEFVRGRTLADAVGDAPMDPMQVASLAMQVADALHAAHRSGIVHRDIKPSNVMVTDDGQVKVLDFGLAAPVAGAPVTPALDTSITTLSTIGRQAGTLAYMSPEQVQGESLDGRTDLFSLGVVLYELSTGRNPFRGSTAMATLGRILTVEPEPIRFLVPGFPRHLDAVIQRCLAKSPGDRYPSAAELLADLRGGASRPLWRRRNVQEMPSLAVLPFTSLGAQQDHEVMADAFCTELTARLAQLPDVLVIARTSALRFRGTTLDASTVARQLGVRFLVDGALRFDDDRCTLVVNLIDAETGFHAWSRTYECESRRIFDVAKEVEAGISGALHVTNDRPSLAPPRPHLGRPMLERYFRALHAYHKFANADNLVAIDVARAIVAEDPSHAKGHALLASAFVARIERGWERDVAHWLGLATQACHDALRLDPELPEAYAARGLISLFSGRLADAEADARESLRVDTNNDIALNLLGRVHFARGEFQGAVAKFRDALTVNPYYVWCFNDLAWALLCLGDEEAADVALDRVLALSPNDEGALSGKSAMRFVGGRHADALALVLRAQQSNASYPFVLQMLPPILAAAGQRAAAEAVCSAVVREPLTEYLGHASQGLVHALSGEPAGARACADRALALHAFHPALHLTYASLYDHVGHADIARELVSKATSEGIRLVEVDQWHPTLRRLAASAGLISTRRIDD